MDKRDILRQVKENKIICNSGKIKLGTKVVDISSDLNKDESYEYRADDIEKINVKDYKKSDNTCKYRVVYYGADELPFLIGKKLCILNFASSKNPGGGFETGAMAQEEALCYASDLWKRLGKHSKFYDENRADTLNGQYKDGIIYNKDVVFFRNKFNNTTPRLVDIITCAAPNWRTSARYGVSLDENNSTLSRRLEQIIKVAIANENKVLVLGAFGCGVFGNDPEYVAKETKRLLEDCGYNEFFDEVIFAMKDKVGKNTRAFKKEFN